MAGINEKVVCRIMDALETEKSGDENTVAKVRYALLSLLDETEKFLLLSVLFWMLYDVWKFYLAFLVLGSVRRYMGGSHRQTKLGCFLSSLVNFGVILCLAHYLSMPLPAAGCVVVLLVLETALWTPLASPQQIRHTARRKRKLRGKALASMAVWCCLYPFLPGEAGNIICWALAFQGAEVFLIVLYRKAKHEIVVK